MLCSSLHHVELCVKDVEKTLHILRHSLGFDVIANRETDAARQIVLRQNNSIFIITQAKSGKYNNEISSKNNIEDWTVFCCDKNHTHEVDSVFNSALNVSNINIIIDRVREKGGKIIKELTTVSDVNGDVQYAIISTPIGNAVHTLINKSNYKGTFLPGFTLTDGNNEALFIEKTNITHIDHVAYVCEEGRSSDIIQWYEDVFGMKRFLLNR